jgi:hypothetical protein
MVIKMFIKYVKLKKIKNTKVENKVTIKQLNYFKEQNK